MSDAGPHRKRPRGGVWQNMRRAEAAREQDGKLYLHLLAQFAMGVLSAQACHAIAACACTDISQARDGASFGKLSRLGSSQKPSRLMQEFLLAESATPKPVVLEMPYIDNEQRNTSVLLPHEYFAAAYAEDNRWQSCMLPLQSKLEVFWFCFSKHPMMRNHPWWERPDRLTKCIPVCVHGDEVPVVGVGKIWSRSALIFSWFSLMANAAGATTMTTTFYIWSVFEKFCIGTNCDSPGFMDLFFQILTWSFHALWTVVCGLTPTGGAAGKSLLLV